MITQVLTFWPVMLGMSFCESLYFLHILEQEKWSNFISDYLLSISVDSITFEDTQFLLSGKTDFL